MQVVIEFEYEIKIYSPRVVTRLSSYMLFSHRSSGNPFLIIWCTILFFLFPSNIFAENQKNYFPEFSVITANVTFWERVYSEFSVNTAVLHDKNDLSIIYETIPLLDRALPGAQRLNTKHLKAVKNKYGAILRKLAKGIQPSTSTEKRVYSLFSPPDIRNKFRVASHNLRTQRGLKERFIEGVIRSGGYIDEMKRIFKSYNLPVDLAYLPHVESSFNVKAYSKYGAAGVWQFTRSTGKEYMTINYIVDERRDPLIATHAAAKYLKRNFNNLRSWPLALTAYNYGHAGMMRAAKKEGSYERIFKNYRQGHFKFASRNFYSEFLAARNIAKILEKSPRLIQETPLRTVTISLKGYAAIQDICTYFNIKSAVLKKYNPSLRPPVWQGEKYVPKGYKLKLPYRKSTHQLASSLPGSILKRNQKRSKFYTVKRGDTAGKIARRHGISLKKLSRANNLNRHALVYVGQTLRIPALGKTSYTVTQRKVESRSANHKNQNIPILKSGKKIPPAWEAAIDKNTSSKSGLSVTSLNAQNGTVYGEIVVQPEESMGMYADWLKISKKKLHILNKMASSAAVHPGQKITLEFSNITRQSFETKRKEFHQETMEDFYSAYKITGFKKYQVAMGDTLWEICQKKFGLPLWLLKKYNANLNYNQLSSDQNLKIPIIEAL